MRVSCCSRTMLPLFACKLRGRQHRVGRVARAEADVRADGLAVMQRIHCPRVSVKITQIQARGGIRPIEAEPAITSGSAALLIFICHVQIHPAGVADALVQMELPCRFALLRRFGCDQLPAPLDGYVGDGRLLIAQQIDRIRKRFYIGSIPDIAVLRILRRLKQANGRERAGHGQLCDRPMGIRVDVHDLPGFKAAEPELTDVALIGFRDLLVFCRSDVDLAGGDERASRDHFVS